MNDETYLTKKQRIILYRRGRTLSHVVQRWVVRRATSALGGPAREGLKHYGDPR